MRTKSLAIFCVAALMLLPLSSTTQSEKAKVYVVQEGKDSVGRAVAYLLKVSRSNRYALVSAESAAEYEIDLISVDIDESRNQRSGEWSAISVIFAIKTPACASWVYVRHGVRISGKSVASTTAQDTLAEFDEMVAARR